MKILLANKFYYPRGGDCIYTIELEKLLIGKGHEVAIFSMQHPSNQASEFSGYFPSHVDFNKRNIKSLISILVRPFGSCEVRRNFKRLISDFKPDIIHLNNIHSQLSPVLALLGHKYNIPVVWTLHDYKLVCPAYLLLSGGKSCEACLDNKWSVTRKKCIKNSFLASLVAYLEAYYWNPRKLNRITDWFISPSNFLKEEMIKGGIDKAKIGVLHNFVKHETVKIDHGLKEDYYCYVGRLSSEKGIDLLLEAASGLPAYKLKIIGTGPLEESLISGNNNKNVEFFGYKTGEELRSIISGSRFLTVPSNWFENNPLTILEALCMGVPVLGSNIGGIPELIKPGFNGILFEPSNVAEMREKIDYLWRNHKMFDRSEIASHAARHYTSEHYYESVIDLYNSLLIKRKAIN
ncbi:MAG: glycosyltransferase family 4 protein [Bacteroidales bacterium]|nr:glycosyltransferase family 4 protein [Bacteroidales bacterium]